MHKSRNQKPKSKQNSSSENDLDLDNNIDIDDQDQFEKNDILDEDFIDNSDMSDEIEKKIDSIYDRNKNTRLNSGKNDNMLYNLDGKDEKKKKEKYDKKIMKNYFNDYFDASHNKIEDYYEVNYPELSKYELKIGLYNELYKLIEEKKLFPSLTERKKKFKDKDDFNEDENYNYINKGNLFSLIYELLFQNFNIFLYGFGSKMNLLYDFINFYQEQYYIDSKIPLYIMSFNLNNPEISMKVIINKIESCLMVEFQKNLGDEYNEVKFPSESTLSGQITKIQNIYKKIHKKDDNDDEKDSSLDEEDEDEEDQEEKNIKKEKEKQIKRKNNNNSKNPKKEKNIKKNKNSEIFEEDMPFKILLVINNIGSSTGQSKLFQEHLSELANILSFVNLVVTCENLSIPYYWTSEVKDKFRFCFLKFNTYEPYDIEIDENNSIKGGNNLKGGEGLREILSSLTEPQNKLIKEIAILTLKNDYDSLTQKGLIEYFVKTGKGIATDIQKLENLLVEARDHEIVTLKLCSANNKEIYKMNFDRNVIERIAEGEYMKK